MTESLATTAPSAAPAGRSASLSPVVEILRDIARGGFTGILVGIFVAGLGGRLVMRLATILHEDTVGLTTENGELIGRISFNGTMALITFGGLGMGLLAGMIWVIVSPWIPGRGMTRALVTALAAIALGTPPLIQRFNPDFFILDHDPVVVAMLVALVALVGCRSRSSTTPSMPACRTRPGGSRSRPGSTSSSRCWASLILARRRLDPADPVRLRRADPARLGARGRGRLHACLVGAPRPGPLRLRRGRCGSSRRHRCSSPWCSAS